MSRHDVEPWALWLADHHMRWVLYLVLILFTPIRLLIFLCTAIWETIHYSARDFREIHHIGRE